MKQNKLFKIIFFMIAISFLCIIGCGETVTSINDIYNKENNTFCINVKASHLSGDYVIFEDSTGFLAYDRSIDYGDYSEGKCYSLKVKVDTVNNIKQIVQIIKTTEIDNFDLDYLSYNKINNQSEIDYLNDNKTYKIEISGYVGYSNTSNIFYVKNKTTDILVSPIDYLNSTKIEGYYKSYVTLKGYIVEIDSANNLLKVETSSVDEDFDLDDDSTFDLHILEMNDTHGYCMQDENGKNGLSNMSYLIENIRQESNNNTILIANGDMFQGTAISNITYGKTILDAMNAMKFDCMTLGNHEFDWGLNTILNYFDNNKDNGEANFPLLNSNVYNNDGSLVTIENGKIYESMVIEKNNIKIGIIGCIGDVYSSINYLMAKDYYFDNNVEKVVSRLGSKLKDDGCDIIVVAIHGGNSSSVNNYTINNKLAQLTYNGNYLVDAVINGHTHTKQYGYIERNNGVKMPVVQAGCNGKALGDIVLKVSGDNKKVVSAVIKLYDVYDADNNYNASVEKVINDVKEEYDDQLSEVYAVAGETINNQNDLIPWVKNVLLTGTGSDICICNTGGLRSNGNIIKGGNITIENLYMINPFDNQIVLVKLKGSKISEYLSNGKIFYGLRKGLTSLESNTDYLIAVIDYVYYSSDFPKGDSEINTGIIMRDLLCEDIKLHNTFSPISNPEAYITNQINQNKIETYSLVNYNNYIYYKKDDVLCLI